MKFLSTGHWARVCSRKPFLVLAIWGVLVLIAGALAVDGELGPGKQLADFLKLTGSAESSRAESLLVERGGQTIPLREIVIV